MAATHTFSRLTTAGQGRRLFLLSWVAYAAAYVGRYNYSAVMSAITAEGTLTLSAAGRCPPGISSAMRRGRSSAASSARRLPPLG